MAHRKPKIVKRKGKSPLIKSPVGPSKRKPTPQERFPSRADPRVGRGGKAISKKVASPKRLSDLSDAEFLKKERTGFGILGNRYLGLSDAEAEKMFKETKRRKLYGERKKGGTVRPTSPKLKRKPKFAEKTHAEITRKKETHKREGDPSPPHTSVGRLGSQRIKDRIAEAARKLPLSKKKHGGSTEAKRARYMKGGPVRTKREAKKGGTVSKRYGGMSHVGLSPAEEARTGTLSEAARRRPRMPTPRLPVRPTSRMPMPQRVRRRPMKKGGTVYRKLNGQVTNGNHVVSKGYRGST